jgi:biotin transport system permease protein
MVNRLTFHYYPGRSLLHRWDARCKLLGMLLLGLQVFQVRCFALTALSVTLCGAFLVSRLPVAFFRELRGWGFMLLVIFCVHAVFTPGSRFTELPWLPVSPPGLRRGALVVWRLGLMLGFASLFTAVTRPRELIESLSWFLYPFRFLPARRIAFMATLTMRFLPLILDELEEVRQANKARLGERRRNPARRVKHLLLPVLRRSFARADELALALAARGYREDLVVEWPAFPPRHFIPVILLCVPWVFGGLSALDWFN